MTPLAPSFSPDGSLFAAAWVNESFVRVLDLATGRTVRDIGSDSDSGRPRSLAFDPSDPSGARIVVALRERHGRRRGRPIG